MIEIEKLIVKKQQQVICSVPHLSIHEGSRCAIVGENGSGKSTLLRVLSGLEQEYQGSCQIELPADKIGFVHQSPYMFTGTVLFNVMYGLEKQSSEKQSSEKSNTDKSKTDQSNTERAMRLLQLFDLGAMATQQAKNLSGGERRKVALARCLVRQPHLILLDEPLADLDEKGCDALAGALDELPESTILFASPTSLPARFVEETYQLKNHN